MSMVRVLLHIGRGPGDGYPRRGFGRAVVRLKTDEGAYGDWCDRCRRRGLAAPARRGLRLVAGRIVGGTAVGLTAVWWMVRRVADPSAGEEAVGAPQVDGHAHQQQLSAGSVEAAVADPAIAIRSFHQIEQAFDLTADRGERDVHPLL